MSNDQAVTMESGIPVKTEHSHVVSRILTRHRDPEIHHSHDGHCFNN